MRASGSWRTSAFPGIINFHEELNARCEAAPGRCNDRWTLLGDSIWRCGVGVWFDFSPLVSAATGIMCPGDCRRPRRSALRYRPLKRVGRCVALRPWLQDALNKLAKSDPAHRDLGALLKGFSVLQTKDHARERIASSTEIGLLSLSPLPANSRALTLYQDFSAAFVLGSKLKQLRSAGGRSGSGHHCQAADGQLSLVLQNRSTTCDRMIRHTCPWLCWV